MVDPDSDPRLREGKPPASGHRAEPGVKPGGCVSHASVSGLPGTQKSPCLSGCRGGGTDGEAQGPLGVAGTSCGSASGQVFSGGPGTPLFLLVKLVSQPSEAGGWAGATLDLGRALVAEQGEERRTSPTEWGRSKAALVASATPQSLCCQGNAPPCYPSLHGVCCD